jgi:transmembrane sensor
VIAVGTEFDVYRKARLSTVTVVDGRVALYIARDGTDVAQSAVPVGALYVATGQQALVTNDTLPKEAVPVDARQVVGWLQRQISFDQQPLGVVAAEFNRYSRVPVEIEDAQLAATPVSGVFDPYDTESFTALLKTLDGVVVMTSPTQIRVSRNASPPMAKKN